MPNGDGSNLFLVGMYVETLNGLGEMPVRGCVRHLVFQSLSLWKVPSKNKTLGTLNLRAAPSPGILDETLQPAVGYT